MQGGKEDWVWQLWRVTTGKGTGTAQLKNKLKLSLTEPLQQRACGDKAGTHEV